MEKYRLCNRSKICELFYGESKMTFKFDCGYQKELEETLTLWTLELPQLQRGNTGNALRIEECMDNWGRETYQKGSQTCPCPRCGRNEGMRYSRKVVQFAPVIMINLNRMTYDGSKVVKDTTRVSYPLELDTADWALMGTGVYDLIGVIHLEGSDEARYYSALVRDSTDLTQWYDILNSRVTPVRPSSGGRLYDQSVMAILYQRRC
jgi:ubiquitin C-terminal hydrolase